VRLLVEDGQGHLWPPSRNPHRCLKAAKAAKAANETVTVLTLLMDLAPVLGL